MSMCSSRLRLLFSSLSILRYLGIVGNLLPRQPLRSLELLFKMVKFISRRDEEALYTTWLTDIPERLGQEHSGNCKRYTLQANAFN